MRRTKRVGGEPWSVAARNGAAWRAGAPSMRAVTAAAGGNNCTATIGVAADSADSMWQQELAAVTTVLPEALASWQHPLGERESPAGVRPRWQKHSPAEAFINAKASTATPRVRARGFIACVLG